MNFSFNKLVVIRHGECQHNVSARYAGQYDSPLTGRGREQAALAASNLRHRMLELKEFSCISSPLSRARITAEIILANFGINPHSNLIDDRLLELNFGDHTNQLTEHVRAFLTENVQPEFLWQYIHPNGESIAQLYERVGDLLVELSSDSLLVCHSGTARMIRAHMLGLRPQDAMDFTLENGSCLIYHGNVEEKI